MAVKIKRGEPIPPPNRMHRQSRWPLSQMLVGESFDAEGTTAGAMHACITRFTTCNDPNKKFSVRTVDGLVKVWRIK